MIYFIMFSWFYGMYLKNSKKLLQMNSESHLSVARTSFFTLFGPYSLHLQGISIPPPMTHFPSGAGLGWPVTSLTIIFICWLFIKLNNVLASVSGTSPIISSFSNFIHSCVIAVLVVLLNRAKGDHKPLH